MSRDQIFKSRRGELGFSQYLPTVAHMTGQEQISARVKAEIQESGLTQAVVAERVGMKADALSRAVNGQRGFSSIELASLADLFRVDVHWLITGEADPYAVRAAARHVFDHETGKRSNPSRSADQQTLEAVALAYQQAYPGETGQPPQIPGTAAEVRALLGQDFVRHFADRVEEFVGVDVVRVQMLQTAYSITVGGRVAIVLPTNPNWFWSNFALAHEVAHLALGHLDVDRHAEVNEGPANAFAAELLMPEADIRARNWSRMSGLELARLLWESGVGTEALRTRLASLGISASPEIAEMLNRRMPGVLRPYQSGIGEPVVRVGPFAAVRDPINDRMQAAAMRRFPQTLLAAHRVGIEAGRIAPHSLAWMLESPVDDLISVDDGLQEQTLDDLMADLGL